MLDDATLVRLRRLTVAIKKIPGTILLLEHLRTYFARDARTVTVNDFDGNLTVDLCLGEHMQSHIFWYGYYSRDIVLTMNKLLQAGMVVCDVGANIGEISMAAAQRVGAAGHVFAFEPMPALHEKLVFNLSRNRLHQVDPVCKGLADKAGIAPIYFAASSFADGTKHEGLGTLYPSEQRASLAGEIELTTLDSFFAEAQPSRLDLVKIDVEGAELDVLRGGERTLARFRPYLILEVQNETAQSAGHEAKDILQFLEQLGYAFFTVGRKARLRPLQPDHLAAFQNVLCVPTQPGTQ